MARPLGGLSSTNKGRTRVIGLRGGPELLARLAALDGTFRVVGSRWQREAIDAGKPRIPTDTGNTRRSLRAGGLGQGRGRARLQARVVGSHVAYFIDSGVRPHGPKHARVLAWKGSQGTIFARRVSGYRKRPFRARMAREGIKRTPMAQSLIDQWNGAA